MCGMWTERFPNWKKSNQFLPDDTFSNIHINNSDKLLIDIKLNGASPMKLNSSTKPCHQKYLNI
jgi:hypothetical protein